MSLCLVLPGNVVLWWNNDSERDCGELNSMKHKKIRRIHIFLCWEIKMCPTFSALKRSCSSVLEETGPPQSAGGTAGHDHSEAARWLLQRNGQGHGALWTARQGGHREARKGTGAWRRGEKSIPHEKRLLPMGKASTSTFLPGRKSRAITVTSLLLETNSVENSYPFKIFF